MRGINTLFNKNKSAHGYFKVDCQSSDDKRRDVWQISRYARHKHKISRQEWICTQYINPLSLPLMQFLVTVFLNSSWIGYNAWDMTRLKNNSQLEAFDQICLGVNKIEAELPRYGRQIPSIIWRKRSNPNSLASTTLLNSTPPLRSLHFIANTHQLYVNPAIKSTAFEHLTGSTHHKWAVFDKTFHAQISFDSFAFGRCSSNKWNDAQGYIHSYVLGAVTSLLKTFGCYFLICYMHFSKGKREKLYDMQL